MTKDILPTLQDAIEDASITCVALQAQVFALAAAYVKGESMNDDLFQSFMWGINRDLETIKKTLDRIPYQEDMSQ